MRNPGQPFGHGQYALQIYSDLFGVKAPSRRVIRVIAIMTYIYGQTRFPTLRRRAKAVLQTRSLRWLRPWPALTESARTARRRNTRLLNALLSHKLGRPRMIII